MKTEKSLQILAFLAVLIAAPACAIAANYTLAWTSGSANTARGAAWGDYDSDGNLDFVVASAGQGTRVWRGNGAGAFTLQWTSAQTDDTRDVAFGDYGRDGDLDIATANAGGQNRVYRNDGVSSFTLVWSSTETDATRSIEWGDYDNDGDLDILAGNYGAPSRIYRNDGAGAFNLIWSTAIGYQTEDAVWADIDNDGDLDFALGNYSQANTVFRNNTGSFALDWSSSETEATRAIAWGDYNGDGYPDLLAANLGQTKRLYRNDSGSGFTSIWTAGDTGPTEDAALGDFDNDGDLDILLANNGQPNQIYKNNGGGAFALDWSTAESDATYGIAWGDYDNDGDLDILAVNDTVTNNRIYSNAPAIANTAPAAPTLATQPDTTPGSITLQWTAGSDAQTTAALLTYDLRVGTSSGGCQIFCGAFAGTSAAAGPGNVSTGLTHALTLATGTYYWTVRTVDTAWRRGAWSAEKSFAVDGSPPTTPTVSDGTAADIAYTTSATTISANWTPSIETQSTLVSYWYSIGTSQFASDTAAWTNNGFSTSVTRAGLTLADGVTYYVSVKTENSAGLMSYATSSNGQMSDTTGPPPVASVSDGPASDIAYSTSGTTISANWPATVDPHSSVADYWYSIGTTAGASNTVSWTNNSASRSIAHSGLTLADGSTYYVSVKARNNAGLFSTVATSNGQYVDTSPPASGGATVSDGPDIDLSYASASAQLSANWSGFSDPHSGITKYWYAIGTTAGATNTADWTNNSTGTSVTRAGLALSENQQYFFSVKAENAAGLISSAVNSNGLLYDTTVPETTSATVLDGPDADLAYATSATTLKANWSGFSDPQSGILKYWYAIGTTTGDTSLTSGWVDNGLSTSITRPGLTLADGQSYFFSVRAENNSRSFSTVVSSNGAINDTTAPPAPASINDGGGADIAFSSSTTLLIANWSPATDPHSGIKRYWYAIGTTSGGTELTGGWIDNGTATYAAHSATYTDGQTYYFSARAENNASLTGAAAISDGQLIDTSPPSNPATVSDGPAADTGFTASNSELTANWSGSTDNQSGIARYWYSIGTTAGASNTAPWTDNGTATSVTRSGLALSNGQTYFFTIKAENNAGSMSAPVSSNGQMSDVTPPDVVFVIDGAAPPDINYTASGSQLSANWSDSADTQSGLLRYWYSIGTSAGASDTVPWTDNGTATSVTRTGLVLADGVTYYFSVAAENNSRIIGTVISSDGQIKDTTPPTDIASVFDGPNNGASFATSSSTLTANWSAASDPHSGITRYWYSIGTSAGASGTLAWTDNGTATSVTRSGLNLIDGVTYYTSVKAENAARLISNITTSSGQMKDTSPPASVAYINDGASADIAYSIDAASLSANWAASSDPHSGLLRYWYSVGTTAGASGAIPWTDNATATSFTAAGLNLTDGTKYYTTIQIENNAGLISSPQTTNGVTIDTTPPAAVAYVNDGTGSDIALTMTGDRLSANWAAAADPHTAISTYIYSIGTTAGASDTAPWTETPNANITRTGLALADTATYYFTVKSRNAAGLESPTTSSNGATYNAAAPGAAITSPAPAQTIEKIVSVEGRIADFSLQSWALYFGPGSSPSSWTTIATGTAGIPGGEIASWDTASLAGRYTLQLSATDTLGANTRSFVTVTIGNPGSSTGTVAVEQWGMMTLPMRFSNSSPEAVFGSDREYKILRWDPAADDDPYLHKYRRVSAIEPGKAFWIIAFATDMAYAATGSPLDTTSAYTVNIANGWNQIAVPFDIDFDWSAVRVKTTGASYTLAEAENAGLISSSIYSYDAAENAFIMRPANTRLSSRNGYFVRAFADCGLEFDPTAALPSGAAKIIRQVSDYRIKISARAAQSADPGNYIGTAAGAARGFDKNDAEEPPLSPSEKYTRLRFTGGSEPFLAADIRPLATGATETWTFNVNTSETGQVSIEWDPASLPSDKFSFLLTALATGETISMADQSAYTYSAASASFRIDVSRRGAQTSGVKLALAAGWNLVALPLEPASSNAKQAIIAKLPGGAAFQFFDGIYFADEAADLQAGIGYWVFSPGAAEIEIAGAPADENAAVELPLKKGWNIAGNPFAAPLIWGDNILVLNNGAAINLSQAVALGIIDAVAFTFDGEKYDAVENAGEIPPMRGFIIRALRDTALIMKKRE